MTRMDSLEYTIHEFDYASRYIKIENHSWKNNFHSLRSCYFLLSLYNKEEPILQKLSKRNKDFVSKLNGKWNYRN